MVRIQEAITLGNSETQRSLLRIYMELRSQVIKI